MNTDRKILDEILPYIAKYQECNPGKFHPLNEGMLRQLKTLRNSISNDTSDTYIYSLKKEVMGIWCDALQNSIVCLRYFDTREPFLENANKSPCAHGMVDIKSYFEKYAEFENIMYGGVKHYRDHLIHVFRVWILGLKVLLCDNARYLEKIVVEHPYEVSFGEKLSMWTIVALTHDLGYPLEKATRIVESTKSMMSSFVHNPILSMDLSFSGVQDSMNDYVVRFISSKMWEIDPDTRRTFEQSSRELIEEENKLNELDLETKKAYVNNKRYVARLQPKYYFKFQKALEHNQHGILSTIVIYKLLLFFMESDYSLNEDYLFDYEDTRQFYICREILRSIASHTCHDVYQLSMLRFSFLLIVCDDLQDWGRKSIAELFEDNTVNYELVNIKFDLKDEPQTAHKCEIKDVYTFKSKDRLKGIIKSIQRLCESYRAVFRDGQDTVNRDFEFHKMTVLDLSGCDLNKYYINLYVSTTEPINIKLSNELNSPMNKNDYVLKVFLNVFKGSKMSKDRKECVHILK